MYHSFYNPIDMSSDQGMAANKKGGLKLNFDGSSKGNPGPIGFRCVLDDSNGNVIHMTRGPLGVCDSTKAAAIGLLMGLCKLKSLGIRDCIVEGE